jgi:hypothetical protein
VSPGRGLHFRVDQRLIDGAAYGVDMGLPRADLLRYADEDQIVLE